MELLNQLLQVAIKCGPMLSVLIGFQRCISQTNKESKCLVVYQRTDSVQSVEAVEIRKIDKEQL